MKYTDYLNMRNQLTAEADAFAEAGDYENAEAKQNEIKALDKKWDAQAKYEADKKALAGEQRSVNTAGVIPTGLTAPVAQVDFTGQKKDDLDPETKVKNVLNSEDYTNAWAKKMMNQELKMTKAEKEALAFVNDAIETGTIQTGTQTAGSILIPANVSQKIIRRIEERHPLIADVTTTYIKGYLTLTFADESSDAAWYEEATPTADGSETFKTVSISGCELARKIRVTYKLAEMAVTDFINYIVEMMSKKMGQALAYGVVRGKGATSDAAAEPLGILTYMAAEFGTPQIIDSGITEANLAAAVGMIPDDYQPKWYANRKTIWGPLYNIKNGVGDSIMVRDPITGGVSGMLGFPVVEEAGIPDGQVLLSDAGEAYHLNYNAGVVLERAKDIEKRHHIFAAYAIADGTVVAPKASVLVKNA